MAQTYVIKHPEKPVSYKVKYEQELNPEQLQVVRDGEGPVLVLAGAGSGKTRTIVYRVAYLLERGVKPDRILLVTFTNKAAREMLLRIEELLGAYPKGLWGGTFHHVANLLMRKYGSAIGYPPNFTILDQEDASSLVGVCIKEEGIDTKQKRFPAPAVIQSIISLSVNTREDFFDIIAQRYPNFIPLRNQMDAVRQRYVARKKRNHLVDFDDLLMLLDDLLRTKPDVRQRLSQQFQYVLVDEYQDTNRLQASIVQQLASSHHNLFVVGDDCQSIYKFRGATVRNILEFPKMYPNCRTFKLETNYRSTAPVLDLANVIIEHNPDQFQKVLKPVRRGTVKPIVVPAASAEQEAEFISQRLLEFREEGVPLSQIAVLFRATFLSQALEFELTRKDIPYDYRGGVRFFERAHIKDVLAYLKLVDNPRDEVAFLRTLQLYVGIGLETALKLWGHWSTIAGSQQSPATADYSELLSQRSTTGFRSFIQTYQALAKLAQTKPSELIEQVIGSDYRDYVQVTYQNAEERLDDLKELARFAERYRSLSSFLAEVSLQESFGVASQEEAEREEEQMVLSTIHQAKGLEWEVVFLIGCNDGAFPNPRALNEPDGIEEERRLFYVAVTRAKTHLYLSYSMGMNMRTTSMYMQRPSPFISELPKAMLEELHLEEEYRSADDFMIDRDELGEPKSMLDRLLAAADQRKKYQKRKGR